MTWKEPQDLEIVATRYSVAAFCLDEFLGVAFYVMLILNHRLLYTMTLARNECYVGCVCIGYIVIVGIMYCSRIEFIGTFDK